MLSESKTAGDFIKVAERFFSLGGNPNLLFPMIAIRVENEFYRPTFFHLVYLAWKWSDVTLTPEMDRQYETLMDRMLDDPRTELTACFSEESLCDREHFYDFEAGNRNNDYEGYTFERMTLAHYAMAISDLVMVEKLLLKAPKLVDTVCCITQGKSLLHENVLSVASFIVRDSAGRVEADQYDPSIDFPDESLLATGSSFKENLARVQNLAEDSETAGEIAVAADDAFSYTSVTRTVKVSLLHIAARLGDELACGYLRAKNMDPRAVDSDQRNPLDTLRLSLSERFVAETGNTKRLLKILEPVMRLQKTILPRVYEMRELEGYEIYYDTRSKVAAYVHERLTQQSLIKHTQREGLNFKVDPEVHKLNRAKHADYTNSGYDRGHLRPASDAVGSEQAMEDSFLLSNICPQLPAFNRNYWKQVEVYIRGLVPQYDLVEVFTGPIFAPQLYTDGKMRVSYETIGATGLSVPTHFFKVLFLYRGIHKTVKAYLFPHREIASATLISSFEESIERVQVLSGILFSDLLS